MKAQKMISHGIKTLFASSLISIACLIAPNAFADDTQKSATADTDMIVGGKTADANKWPWQVRLFEDSNDKTGICGGTLIAKQWVLTAAHCTKDHESFVVGYGSNKLAKLKRVDSIMVLAHQAYDPLTMQNDIALIKLKSPVTFGGGATNVDLASPEFFQTLEGKKTTVTGWGYLYDADAFQKKYPGTEIDWNSITPTDLQEVEVPVQNFDACRASYTSQGANDIPEGQMCAGLKHGGKDSCQGDSGGPLVAPDPSNKKAFVQVGIVSWGRGCAQPKLFGIYTRTDFYADWIKNTITANK